jgi:hypothetical protein
VRRSLSCIVQRTVGAESEEQGRRVFRYSLFSHAMVVAFQCAYLWSLCWAYGRNDWRMCGFAGSILFPFLLWEWWGGPLSFVVQDGAGTAYWLWGRRRSWSTEELTIPGATSSWSLSRRGYATVRQRDGKKAFNLSVHLQNFSDFVELIEAGSKAARETPSSGWWNRELFK